MQLFGVDLGKRLKIRFGAFDWRRYSRELIVYTSEGGMYYFAGTEQLVRVQFRTICLWHRLLRQERLETPGI